MADNPQIQAEKLLKYGKKQLLDKGVTAQPTTLREVLDNISNVETGGDYDVYSVQLADGTQKYVITTLAEGERPKDMLQARVDGCQSCEYLFSGYKETELDISRLDTSKATDMSYMFQNCSNLTSLDVSNFNTSNVTTMYYMFSDCKLLTILDLSSFNISNVTTMENMFRECRSLTSINLSNFNTSNVTDMSGMFYYCEKLTSLDLSNFDTSNVTDISSMFNCCKNLTNLDLSSFDTSNVTNMMQLFSDCYAITNIIGNIDMINTTQCIGIFSSVKNLVNVTLKNIKISLTIGSSRYNYGTKLSDNTIINTFQELWDLTGGTTRTLELSTPSNARTEAIYVKLIDVTDEMREKDQYVDNKKPCVVCESTDEGAMTLKEYGISKNWNIA